MKCEGGNKKRTPLKQKWRGRESGASVSESGASGQSLFRQIYPTLPAELLQGRTTNDADPKQPFYQSHLERPNNIETLQVSEHQDLSVQMLYVPQQY